MKLVMSLSLMAAALWVGAPAFAADPAGTGSAMPGGKNTTVTGTIEGEVKKVQPDAVIIEKEKDGEEVRLQLNESTHKGDIKQGDKVEAFVTPGGNTTSVQPREGGLNR